MNLSGRQSRHKLLMLVALLLLLAFAFQGSRNLWETDEGRYTNVALQMLSSGNFLMPALNDETPHFTKPPVAYWAIAGALTLFGHSVWAVRTPYALAFVLTGLLLFGMGKRLTPEQPWLAPLIYACSLGPFIAANVVSTDELLTLFEALAVYGYIAFRYAEGRRLRRRWLWVMWLGFALAFETKGPPGLLPLLAILVFTGVREGRRALAELFTLAGVTTFIVVGLFWYALVIWKRPALAHYFLQQEVLNRVLTGEQHRHPQWYGWFVVYAPMLGAGSLPWWPALVRGMRPFLRLRHWLSVYRHRPGYLFLLVWFLLPLLVFCLAESRLLLYVLPLFLPLSLMLALKLAGRAHLNRPSRRWLLVGWVALLIAIKAVLAFWIHPGRDDLRFTRALNARVDPSTYDALVFVNARMYQGMRFYLQKPLYRFVFNDPRRNPVGPCQVLRRHPDALYAVGARHAHDIADVARHCGFESVERLGHWKGDTLFRLSGHGAPDPMLSRESGNPVRSSD